MSGKKTKPSTKKGQQVTVNKPQIQLSLASIDKRMFWILMILAFTVFANTLTHGFVLDDLAVIEQNKFVQQGFTGIPKLLTTFYWEGYWNSNAGLYRPLSMVSFAIEWGISPNNPFLHHLINVLLYSISIGALYRLLRSLFPDFSMWIPFCISLLFAVHPIHTEVVANIKSRDEILCFLFFVLTFRYVIKNGLHTLKHQIIASSLFLLCLLSKEAGVLFLPIMGIYVLLFQKLSFLKTARLFLPLVLVTIAWLALHQYVIQSSSFERITYSYLDNSVVGCPDAGSQVATGIAIFGKYLFSGFVPLTMSYDYSYNQIPCETFGSPVVLVTLIILIGIAYLIYKNWKTKPAISFGLLYFLISIALVSNIFTLIGATMGDRLLYAPVLGICIVVVFGVYYLFQQTTIETYKHSAFYSIVMIAFFFSIMSMKRNRVWESNETLFAADVLNAPNSSRVHFNYGALLMAQLPENTDQQAALLPEVITLFERALEIDSLDRGSHVNLGVCYYRLKEYPKSIIHTKKAIQLDDRDSSILMNLADAYFKNTDFDSAIVYYQKVITSPTATASNYNFLGVAWFNLQKYTEAIAVFKKGLKRFPKNEELLMNLGNAYGASQQFKQACSTFEEVVLINPNNKQAMQFLAMSYERLGDLKNTQKYLDLMKNP